MLNLFCTQVVLHTRPSVLQLEVFIFKFWPVDGFATSSIVICEVATLAHEVGNDPVKGGSFEAKALLSSAKSTEVLSGLWDNIASQLKKEQEVAIKQTRDFRNLHKNSKSFFDYPTVIRKN